MLSPDFQQDLEPALTVLNNGGLILYPTDTIWGIGCDATDPLAVSKVFQLKQREETRSLIVLMADRRDILKYTSQPDLRIFDFLDTVTKPTTIIYEGAMGLASNLVGADGTVAIRLVNDPFCRHLVKRYRKPIVSTSANISGQPAPANFDAIDSLVKEGVDYRATPAGRQGSAGAIGHRKMECRRQPHSDQTVSSPGGHTSLRLKSYLRAVKKFLVIQTAFIGDVVLATGIIEQLHAHFPDARIDFMLRKGNEALLTGHPFIHEVLVWDKKEHKLRNLFRLIKKVRRTKYDTVINVQRFAATGMLTVFSGAKETIGFDKNPWSRWFTKKVPHVVSTASAPLHEVQRNQALIQQLTGDEPGRPRLYPSEKDLEKVAIYKGAPYITISPASVWFTKQYPKEKWVDFIKKIPASYKIFLLGAPSDAELCAFIRRDDPKVTDLSGKLSFLQSAALMRDAQMNYTNDSAPMHFASALNAPVTAVYCSTIPAFGFGPLSDIRAVVEIQEPLDCRPCGLHGYKACPLGHFKCAYHIRDEQLLNSIPL